VYDDVTLYEGDCETFKTVSEGRLLILHAGSRIDVGSVIGGGKCLEVVVSVERWW
jgi:hypothetical protein